MTDKLQPLANKDKPSKVETAKQNSKNLRGTISEVLNSDATNFDHDDYQVMKFHGIYQQDDRDARPAAKALGQDKHHMFMIRIKVPGGVLTPDQYLAMDRLADEVTHNASLRVTTRQTYHPGPYEAGVFYVRHPDEPTGRIFSVTDKAFPTITGDGRRTLERLIWDHPRYRMQAGRYLKRFAEQRHRVLEEGETLSLALAGNHCQGTMFTDGAHLITPDFERRIDEIAQQVEGFYFGRFDLRYADPERLKAGEGFAILELNGVSSESTNIYDPSWSILRAYRTLFRQWELAYRIGHANRRRGHRPTGAMRLLRMTYAHFLHREVELVSD